MNDLARLDARSFHSRLGDLLRVEFVALGAFLRALAEFDRRKLYRDLGHASLFDYLHRGLRLSRGAAHYRRAGASLVQSFPQVLAPIEDGRLCFSTVAVVASVLTEENRAEVLPRFYGLSKQEALELAAELRPRAVVPMRTVVTRTERAELAVPVSVVEAPAGINGEFSRKVHPGELDTAPATAEVAAATTVEPMTAVVPMTATASRLHITVSREFLALLKKAKAGESHRNPGATDEQILKLALEALIEKQGKRRASVPTKVKREVVARDDGKCQWHLADGSVCGATTRLEIDHIHPRGRGGPSTVENCRVLCRGHNLEAARQAYGDGVMDLFTRSAREGDGAVAREEVAKYEAAAATGGARGGPGEPGGREDGGLCAAYLADRAAKSPRTGSATRYRSADPSGEIRGSGSRPPAVRAICSPYHAASGSWRGRGCRCGTAPRSSAPHRLRAPGAGSRDRGRSGEPRPPRRARPPRAPPPSRRPTGIRPSP
ncbi:MAG TPA: HNH endonuclease signature motif containing protein [Anaeromyxobacteraceae bacterium]|nr:HNH endonuclease signature motif containing protein [Anaeromyxobacteraceae bacterium]